MARLGRGVLLVERSALRRRDSAAVTDLINGIDRFCAAWNQRCQRHCCIRGYRVVAATLLA
jgi:hypothetical protein